MDRNKEMFDLLVDELCKQQPKENRELYELMYLVISNCGKMEETEWKFEAEAFVSKHDPNLIFEPGPEGLSALQIAAADKDIHMLLALLKSLTKDPGKLEQVQANLKANNDLTLEDKWNQCVNALLEDLPNEVENDVQNKVLNQLQTVRTNNKLLINAEPYTQAYSSFDHDPSDANWQNIGHRQRTMPLHARADVYFQSLGSNDEQGPHPLYFEPCGARDFKFYNKSLLFSRLAELGPSFSLVRLRDWCDIRIAGTRGMVGIEVEVRADSAAITRFFKVKTQQLDNIVDKLQELALQKVNISSLRSHPPTDKRING